jgi:hypothetical protein
VPAWDRIGVCMPCAVKRKTIRTKYEAEARKRRSGG